MKKTKGQRFKNLFDELDMKIIQLLYKKDYGVLELTKELNVEHKTAKKHIDKLVDIKFIDIKQEPQNKKLLFLPHLMKGFLIRYKELLGLIDSKKAFEELARAMSGGTLISGVKK